MQLITEKIIKQLARATLPTEDRVALTNALLKKLNTLPIGDVIMATPDGGIVVNGKNLDREQTLSFKEACVSLKENFARKVIHEQIRFKAIEMGILKSTSIDTLMFAKAAIWDMNEYEVLLEKLQ